MCYTNIPLIDICLCNEVLMLNRLKRIHAMLTEQYRYPIAYSNLSPERVLRQIIYLDYETNYFMKIRSGVNFFEM